MSPTWIATDAGRFRAFFSGRGLCRLEFPQPEAVVENDTALPPLQGDWLRLSEEAVRRILAGRPVGVLPPLDLESGTPFQREVWRAIAAIPLGLTRTYLEIATSLNRPRATRAVGRACGANPIPLIIPCHRVVAVHGRLGGFSGGLDWKRRLLAVEETKELRLMP